MAERYAIVVDGTACLSKEVEQEFDIRWLPLHVDIGKETYTAGVDLSPSEFYSKIAAPGVLTGTSQPNMGECRDVYDGIAREGTKKMLVLTVATELSGTYSVATTTAQAMPQVEIEVIDTRSGRVSGAQALFGSMLQVKPILEVGEGKVHPIDRVRTRDKAVARMKEIISERVPAGARLHACTLHTNDPERARGVAEWVQERFHCVEHWTAEAGPVIGARAGPGVVGLCWYREDEI